MTSNLEPFFARQAGVATTRQADRVGLNREARRDLVKSGALREMRRGIVACGVRWDAANDVGNHPIELAGCS
jgi:hypothetical protein